MQLYRDNAVVVRQHKLGEADRIVTLLTYKHGLVRAVAKGVRRTRSKFGARLEPFAYVDVQLHPGRSLDVVTQVHTVESFASDIVADYGRYTTACAVLETAERLAGEERAPAPRLHTLTMRRTARHRHGPPPPRTHPRRIPVARHGFRRLGSRPGRLRPLRHSRPASRLPRSRGRRGLRTLPSPGAATPMVGVLEHLGALHRGDWSGVEAIPDNMRRQASGLVAAHLQWHLERQLRTLPLIERTRPHGSIESAAVG